MLMELGLLSEVVRVHAAPQHGSSQLSRALPPLGSEKRKSMAGQRKYTHLWTWHQKCWRACHLHSWWLSTSWFLSVAVLGLIISNDLGPDWAFQGTFGFLIIRHLKSEMILSFLLHIKINGTRYEPSYSAMDYVLFVLKIRSSFGSGV